MYKNDDETWDYTVQTGENSFPIFVLNVTQLNISLLSEGQHIVFNIRLFSHVYWDYTSISYSNYLSEVSKQPVALVEENCKKIEILFQFVREFPKFQNTDLSWKFLRKMYQGLHFSR